MIHEVKWGERVGIEFQFFILWSLEYIQLPERFKKEKTRKYNIHIHSVVTVKDCNIKQLNQHQSVAEERNCVRNPELTVTATCSRPGNTPVPPLESYPTSNGSRILERKGWCVTTCWLSRCSPSSREQQSAVRSHELPSTKGSWSQL